MDRASIASKGWREVAAPPFLTALTPTSMWVKGHCQVIYTMMENHKGRLWNHASISCPDRYPTWDEILEARYTFFTDEDEVFQRLPPKKQYLNHHPYCFHLWHILGTAMLPEEDGGR